MMRIEKLLCALALIYIRLDERHDELSSDAIRPLPGFEVDKSNADHDDDDDDDEFSSPEDVEEALAAIEEIFFSCLNRLRTLSNTARMEYIDRSMAERFKSAISTSNTPSDEPPSKSEHQYTSESDLEFENEALRSSIERTKSHPDKHSAQHLSEVDLGPSAAKSNLARTSAALTGQSLDHPAPTKGRRRKPRLGRNGKPLRPRPRKGPDPEDIERAALVEQVLHENGYGTYDAAKEIGVGRRTGQDEAADEKIASEFQQQFLDAIAERKERQQKQNQAAGSNKDTSATISQGPRLGGSRSARARMAAAQTANTMEKK
ncbi:hypothetical protein LTS08_003952 [Lithohypha guttulata]|nr:hypothetical protein LTS08_003952 [Lithohypha guttulata]